MKKVVAVSGVFQDQSSAADALEALWKLGVPKNLVSVTVPDAGTFKADDEGDVDWPKAMARGAEVGVPVGALAGLALMAVAHPVFGMALLAGIPGGVVLGALLGGTAGLVAMVPADAHGERYHTVKMDGHEFLVVVQTPEPKRIHEVLARHGAVCFLDEMHLVDSEIEAV
jgi:hypothetical protein